jgi:NitT/TauT family transport system permease protein
MVCASTAVAARGISRRGASGFLALLLLWAWTSSTAENVYLPSPASVWRAAVELVQADTIWTDVKVSFIRVTAGFLLSALIAVPFGIWMGSFKLLEALVQPLIEFIRYVPVPALIPILMLLFDLGELSKIMLIFVGTFFQLLLLVTDAVRRVPADLLQVSFTLGARRAEVIRLVLARLRDAGDFRCAAALQRLGLDISCRR